MICFLTCIAIFLVLYAYFGYPALLYLFSLQKNATAPKPKEQLPSVSIIVTARNEEQGIKDKILGSLAVVDFYKQQAGGEAELIIASDASEDRTDEIVKNFEDRNVRLIRADERGGKEKAQKLAASQAKGEIIFFTDVRAEVDSNLLEKLANYFADPAIGAVSTKDLVISSDEGGSGEGFYVRYEMFLRSLESRFNTLVGLSGSGFAVRKDLCLSMRDDIPSDFALLLQCRKAGYRGIHAEDLECRYHAVKTEEQEFKRKIRTVLRGITTFFQAWDSSFLFSDPIFAWQLISHKLCRWLVPWALIVSFVGLNILIWCGGFFLILALLMYLGFALAALGYFRPEYRENTFVKIPLFFMITNAAILVAWIKYFKGDRSLSWTPSKRPGQ